MCRVTERSTELESATHFCCFFYSGDAVMSTGSVFAFGPSVVPTVATTHTFLLTCYCLRGTFPDWLVDCCHLLSCQLHPDCGRKC